MVRHCWGCHLVAPFLTHVQGPKMPFSSTWVVCGILIARATGRVQASPPEFAVGFQNWLCRSWLTYQRSSSPHKLEAATPEPTTQCLLSSLLLVLHRLGATNPPHTSSNHCSSLQHTLRLEAQALLPVLCQLAATQSCHAGTSASLAAVMLRTCQLSPSDWLPIVSKHLHLVQAMAQAFHQRSLAIQALHGGSSATTHADPAQDAVKAENLDSANAELEGSIEGSLLALALYLAQSSPGAQMLLDQGVAEFIPMLAKWLLGPDGGGQPADCHSTWCLDALTLNTNMPPKLVVECGLACHHAA